MTSTPRDEATCLWAAGLRRKRYSYSRIAQMLVNESKMPHCSSEGARLVVAEGIRLENQMIQAEIEDDPYAEGTREFILDRMRARVKQAEELDMIAEESWELVRQHPDITIIEISPVLKWVSESRERLLGTTAEGQVANGLPSAPDREMQRRIEAAGDPGV